MLRFFTPYPSNTFFVKTSRSLLDLFRIISIFLLAEGSLRLYGSGTDDGILEVYHSGRWGTVCDDGWGTEESLVACRQLGYTTFVSYAHGNTINTDFWLDDVTCIGNESLLLDCSNRGWGVDNCYSSEGIYINCTNGNVWLQFIM